jgi:site-specific DNA-methyltransferase (adenine-specific)
MRGEVIWNKASSASPSTAWGSWLSPKNPVLRDIHEGFEKPQKRVKTPQKYIKKRLLQGVNQNPL